MSYKISYTRNSPEGKLFPGWMTVIVFILLVGVVFQYWPQGREAVLSFLLGDRMEAVIETFLPDTVNGPTVMERLLNAVGELRH